MGRKRRKPSTDKWDVLEKAKRCIPPVETILDNAWSALSLDEEFIRHYFGEALRQIDERAMEIYLKHERRAMKFAAQEWLEQRRKLLQREWDHLSALLQEDRWEAFKRKVVPMFMDFAQLVQRLEKDLGNMRKARGGLTFERAVEKLLSTIAIPYERPRGREAQKLERIDLVSPDVKTALNEPERAIFLTLKRTLRERWKQEVPAAQGRRCWLLTLDPDITETKADEIHEKGLEAFVPEEVAVRVRQKGKIWVRSLDELPKSLREALEG
ncbi:type II restriction endonuclease [Fervidibacter sp.]